MGIDATVNAWLEPAADAFAAIVFFAVPVGGAELPLVVLWLAAGALYFTLRFRFINVRGFRHALHLVSGRLQRKHLLLSSLAPRRRLEGDVAR